MATCCECGAVYGRPLIGRPRRDVPDDVRRTVEAVLGLLGRATARNLSIALGISREAAHVKLSRALAAGALVRTKRGEYAVSGSPPGRGGA